MATVGRKKRKRKPGSRTGVAVKPYTRSPRGPNSVGGKRKRRVVVDGYQRGKPRKTTQAASHKRRKKRKSRRR
jgi:hypothetical protein